MKCIIYGLLICSLVSCNKEIYPSIKHSKFSLKKDSTLLMQPKYLYHELANSEHHDASNWRFVKDTGFYFQIFNQELLQYFKNYKNIDVKNYRGLSDEVMLNSFGMLARGSLDSVNLALNNSKTNTNHKTAYLIVDFVINKESGTSGIGPMGNFTKMGEFDFYLMVLQADSVIYYSSMKRFASFFNRSYNSKRSSRAIKAFFRRI